MITYLVAIDAIDVAIESRDVELLVVDLFDSNSLICDDTDAEDVEPERDLSIGAAMVQIVLHRPMDPSCGSQYGYAYEFLCGRYGKPLHNFGSSAECVGKI